MNAAAQTCVWVVEDDPDLLELLAHVLRRAGLVVVPFERGQDVLRRMEAGERPGLLLTDHHLGETYGLELVEALRARAPGAPALLHTAFADRAVRARAAELDVPVVDKTANVYALRRRVLELI